MNVPLLETAAEFLAFGLDRYAHTRGEASFEYKLAVVSIHLGVELLMKERLRRINELYIYDNLNKFDVILKIKHMADPEVRADTEVVSRLRQLQPKTVPFSECVRRLSHLSRACRESAKALCQLADVRNSLVHFGVTSTSESGTDLDPLIVEKIRARIYERSMFLGSVVDNVSRWREGKNELTLWFIPENRTLMEILDRKQHDELCKIISGMLKHVRQLRFRIETGGIEEIDRLLGERIFPFLKQMFDELGESPQRLLGEHRVSFLEKVIKVANNNSELRVAKLIGKHGLLFEAMSKEDKALRGRVFKEKFAASKVEEEYLDKCPACGEAFYVFSDVDIDEDTGFPSGQFYYGTCSTCGLDLDPMDLEIAGMYPEPDETL